jgi:PTS system galactitol-specific IIA component
MFSLALSVARLDVRSASDAIRALASRLLEADHVKATFERAVLAREKRSPTGLPFSPWAVALPHADPEHATSPAIAVATLVRPVRFRQMGSPVVELEVSIVVMPAFTAKEQAASTLSRLIGLLQAEKTRERLVSADSPEDVLGVLAGGWDGPSAAPRGGE